MTNKPQALEEQMIEDMARAIATARSWQTTQLTVGNWDDRSRKEREPFIAMARAAHSLMAAKVAELESENARLRERLNGARAVSKRLGHDLLREEADAALASFGTEWEPLRNVAARAGAQSAAWLASRARELQSRGLVESRWIGNDRTSSFKVWRLAVRAALAPEPTDYCGIIQPSHPERHE